MDTAISAAEANRNFSHVLREVRGGATYVVTAHGKPVARIVPCDTANQDQRAARERLMQRLTSQPASETPIGPWSREELYEF